jgi:hypothetical protein
MSGSIGWLSPNMMDEVFKPGRSNALAKVKTVPRPEA